MNEDLKQLEKEYCEVNKLGIPMPIMFLHTMPNNNIKELKFEFEQCNTFCESHSSYQIF